VHDPGKIVADLAAAVGAGRDCLADIAVLREQPALAGPVASDPVVSRLARSLAADGPRVEAIRTAREWAAAPGADGGLVTIDLDATIVIAHSEREQASAAGPLHRRGDLGPGQPAGLLRVLGLREQLKGSGGRPGQRRPPGQRGSTRAAGVAAAGSAGPLPDHRLMRAGQRAQSPGGGSAHLPAATTHRVCRNNRPVSSY
jgi:Transposase DDE domain group 1